MSTFYVWEEKLRIFEWPKGPSVVITNYFPTFIFLFALKIIFNWKVATLSKDWFPVSLAGMYRCVTKLFGRELYVISFPILPHSLVGVVSIKRVFTK